MAYARPVSHWIQSMRLEIDLFCDELLELTGLLLRVVFASEPPPKWRT